jgi:hypothetical protein
LLIGFGYAFPMLITVHWTILVVVGIVWNPLTMRWISSRCSLSA